MAQSLDGRLVLVTGATGFVGRPTVRALLERGARVRVLVRSGGGESLGPRVQAVPVEGLIDRRALDVALRGADAVIHLAARVHQVRDAAADPLDEYRKVNVEGTRTVLERALEHGVRRFVHVSTVSVLGQNQDGVVTEATPPDPRSDYGRSKVEAEGVVESLVDGGATSAVILRPPLVYGPDVKGNFLRLMRLVDRALPIPVPASGNRRTFIYVGNLVEAVLAAATCDGTGSRTYLVGDGITLSTRDLVRHLAGAMGRRVLTLPVPEAPVRLVGRVGDVLSRVAPFPVTTAEVDRLFHSLVVDSTRFERDTGYRPRHTFEEGLRHTVEWYRSDRRGEER